MVGWLLFKAHGLEGSLLKASGWAQSALIYRFFLRALVCRLSAEAHPLTRCPAKPDLVWAFIIVSKLCALAPDSFLLGGLKVAAKIVQRSLVANLQKFTPNQFYFNN